MSIEEVRRIEDLFIPYDGLGKMKTFHNKETGEVIVILYDPNILGITKLKDILTLSQEGLRNLNLYFKTREVYQLQNILSSYRKYKKENPSIVELMIPLQQQYNEEVMKAQVLLDKVEHYGKI